MGEHLTDTDWHRIRNFASTPTYDRDPEMLLPGSTADEDESGDQRPVDG